MFDGIKSQQVPPEKEEAPQLTELSPWDLLGPKTAVKYIHLQHLTTYPWGSFLLVLKQLRGYQPTFFWADGFSSCHHSGKGVASSSNIHPGACQNGDPLIQFPKELFNNDVETYLEQADLGTGLCRMSGGYRTIELLVEPHKHPRI